MLALLKVKPELLQFMNVFQNDLELVQVVLQTNARAVMGCGRECLVVRGCGWF